MARRSIEERLAQLEAQKKTLQARLGKQERAEDTRRKVLIGALVLQRLETSNDNEFAKRLSDWLRRELPGFLTRDGDKALFPDLLEAPAKPAVGEANAPKPAFANQSPAAAKPSEQGATRPEARAPLREL
jgi:hypothetical protein